MSKTYHPATSCEKILAKFFSRLRLKVTSLFALTLIISSLFTPLLSPAYASGEQVNQDTTMARESAIALIYCASGFTENKQNTLATDNIDLYDLAGVGDIYEGDNYDNVDIKMSLLWKGGDLKDETDDETTKECQELSKGGIEALGFSPYETAFVDAFYQNSNGKYKLVGTKEALLKTLLDAAKNKGFITGYDLTSTGDLEKLSFPQNSTAQSVLHYLMRRAFDRCFKPTNTIVGSVIADPLKNGVSYAYSQDGQASDMVSVGRLAEAITTDAGTPVYAETSCSGITSAINTNLSKGSSSIFYKVMQSDEQVAAGERSEANQQTSSEYVPQITDILSRGTEQVGECLRNSNVSYQVIVRNPSESAGKITTADGETTVPSGQPATLTKGDGSLYSQTYIKDSSVSALITPLAEWLAYQGQTEATGPSRTPGFLNLTTSTPVPTALVVQQTNPPLLMDISIPTDGSLGQLLGCLSTKVLGLRNLLESLGQDLQAAQDAYDASLAASKANSPSGDAPVSDDCLAQDDFMGWIVCPLINAIDSVMESIEDKIQGMLQFDLNTQNRQDGLRKAWNIFRSLASVLIMVGFLLALLVKSIRGE